jgi:uncharacterized metal-binding protein YceD (DUF177 family)
MLNMLLYLRGEASTVVNADLSALLRADGIPVHAIIDLALLHKEEHSERLPEDTDYLVVEEQDVVLAEIIEDELLLNIPFTPMHDDCDLWRLSNLKNKQRQNPSKRIPFWCWQLLKSRQRNELDLRILERKS